LEEAGISIFTAKKHPFQKNLSMISDHVSSHGLILYDSGSQPFFQLRTPWQPISINCTLHISKMFVINTVVVT